VKGVRVLERDGLERRWWGSSQRLADRPASSATPDWDQIAPLLNGYLGSDWPAPPWDADQVATVALCLSMAVDGE
jgi:hypothetical protein